MNIAIKLLGSFFFGLLLRLQMSKKSR